MDDPALEPARHQHALQGLARLNWWSRSASILWGPIASLARRLPRRPLRLLDLATGAGDVPIALWRGAQRAGVRLEIAGCDRSPVAIAHAQARAQRAGAGVQFFAADALTDPLPAGYDIVACSLFLHHLSDDDASRLLRRMAQSTRHLLLVNDLVRSRAGLALAMAGTRLLCRSSIVHADGPQSVRAAYTLDEARRLAEAAGLQGVSIIHRWPCRFLLSWSQGV
jgi:2-polyprenyl-3-methyl-5-hydroxy-6-metoxy-1,4-benzoquinol methylase